MQKKTIFVVDDSDTTLTAVAKTLEKRFKVITLPSAVKMFSMLEKITPSLILLDVEMPILSGYEAIKRLKANENYLEIPVIFLTGLEDSDSEAYGIELGAVDFIAKPFSETVLMNRVRNHVNLDDIFRERTEQLRERTEQLFLLHNNIVFTLADLVESRDHNTGGHIDRTTSYLKILTEALLLNETYIDEMRTWNIEAFVSSARLHDLGKIAVPDSILNKPGKLTNEEFQIMKSHPLEGERLIDQMVSRTGDSEFLQNAKLSAAYHHERWDGRGYPYGIKGSEIPLNGRIMAIVDVYDALTSERPYKKAYTSEEALNIIEQDAGSHFDPLIAEVFCGIRNQIEAPAALNFPHAELPLTAE